MPTLTRRQIALIALLVAVVANLGLLALTALDRRALADKEDELFALQRRAVTLTARTSPGALAKELQEAEEKASETALAFPTRVDAIALQDHLVQAARKHRVQLTSLSLQPSATRDLAAGKYPIVALAVKGQGQLSSVVDFLGEMERSVYTTSTLENIAITQGDGRWSIQCDVIVLGRSL